MELKHARTGALVGLAATLVLSCSRSKPLEGEALFLQRERVAALFAEALLPAGLARMPDAWEEVQPLLEKRPPHAEDLLRGALVLLALDEEAAKKLGFEGSRRYTEAQRLLKQAQRDAPDMAAVHYNLGRVATKLAETAVLDWTAADPLRLASYRRALELAPNDYPTKLALAKVLDDMEDDAGAGRLYRELVAVGFADAGRWHLTALYKLSQVLMRAGEEPEAVRLNEEKKSYEARGIEALKDPPIEMGNLGRIRRPDSIGTAVSAPARLRETRPGALRALPDGLTEFELLDLWFIPEPIPDKNAPEKALATVRAEEAALTYGGPSAVVAWGPAGARVVSLGANEPFEHVVSTAPIDLLEPLDLDNDFDLDFVSVHGRELRFHRNEDDTWHDYAVPFPALPGAPSDLVAVDYDHEGDLDLVAVGPFGVRLLRNDGAAVQLKDKENKPLGREGRFTDATPETGLPADVPFAWCVTEDYDTDQDVDLLLGGAGRAYLASSARGGRFTDESAGLPAELARSARPFAADLDGDARPELAVPGDGVSLFRGSADLRFAPAGAWPASGAELSEFDLDLDGAVDVLASGMGSPSARLAAGFPIALDSPVPGLGEGIVVLGDLDGDLAAEAVTQVDGELASRTLAPGARGPLVLCLRGKQDNRLAVGAVVEVRAGPIYRRIYWRGLPVTIGLGGREQVDILRVTWPNGVVQHAFDVAAGRSLLIRQKDGEVASCPFLYAWNGTTYGFVSDVLGITPLGLPMAPGVLVPPDHDEYVLVRGDELVPRRLEDGSSVYELQLTEELREVTYLDRVRLDVVDHPAGTEVFPNERFTFPPFPEPHTHTVRAPLVPLSALDPSGRDWASELAARDDRYAVPFEVEGRRFMGLAGPHWLELAFDPAEVRRATKLRLFATGWFLWTNASVNLASARMPGFEFVPPIVQVPDGSGGWRDAGPPIGFPAGKTKTMVVDLAGLLDAETPRFRLFTTLAIYWDALRLGVDGDDAPLVVHPLEPAYAHLWERGFSRPILRPEDPYLDWFVWDELEDVPRWNQHPGQYTRFGDVLPLLGAIDDRFVILGAGDALTLRFDADAVPPLADGSTRDYLLFLDGWAKDRDPNTLEALYVEPLPFHGMSGYPYGHESGERFPDGEEHRRWRREWNTRDAKRWIEPLAHEHEPAILRGDAFSDARAEGR